MNPDQLRETLKTRGVSEAELLREEDVAAMDTATLRKMGLGRTPSGRLTVYRSPSRPALMPARDPQDSATRTR